MFQRYLNLLFGFVNKFKLFITKKYNKYKTTISIVTKLRKPFGYLIGNDPN